MQMPLDRSDREKLYIQLTDIFLLKIRSGEWQTGGQIPTEEELCRGFNVSKITVRRAITNLVLEGFLEKLQGKGTFVRQGPPRSGILMKTILVESVFSPEDTQLIKIIDKKIMDMTDEDVARKMGPVIDRETFYLNRLKAAEGVPVFMNEIFIPLRVCPTLSGWSPDGGSVFEYLREHAAPKITSVSQEVEVAKPGDASTHLNIRPTSSCMVIHRVFKSSGDVTVAYSRTTARPDRFRLLTEFFSFT